jgi:hypothetical protein
LTPPQADVQWIDEKGYNCHMHVSKPPLIFSVLALALFASATSFAAERFQAEYPYHGRDVGLIYPSIVQKGYRVSFLSMWEGYTRGYFALSDDPFPAGYDYVGSREIQIRQSNDGKTWSAWSKNIGSGSIYYGVPGGGRAEYAKEFYQTNPVEIAGNYVQVRHRINTAGDSWVFSDGDVLGNWKVQNITVEKDAQGPLDPWDRSAVAVAYFRDFTALAFVDKEFQQPDFTTFPHSGDNNGQTFSVTEDELDPSKAVWDFPISQNWIEAYVQRLNFFRLLAGVPPVSPASDADQRIAQRTALGLYLLDAISHSIITQARSYSQWWTTLLTEEEQWACENGFLSSFGNRSPRSAFVPERYIDPVVEFIDDQFPHNVSVGHRRTLLNPTLSTIAIGGTEPSYSRIHHKGYWITAHQHEMYAGFAAEGRMTNALTRGFSDLTRDRGIMWPTPGYVPYDVVPARFSGHGVLVDVPEVDAIEIDLVDTIFTSWSDYSYDDGFVLTTRSDQMEARVRLNGESIPVVLLNGAYDARNCALDFVIDFPPMFREELRKQFPDHEEIDVSGGVDLRFDSFFEASVYPKPANGEDVIDVEVWIKVDQVRQSKYALPPKVKVFEYQVRPYVPVIAIPGDAVVRGENAFNARLGWYSIKSLPWIYLYTQKTWVYLSSPGGSSVWAWDSKVGWFLLTESYPWVYSSARGWMFFLRMEGNTRVFSTSSGKILKL